MSWRQSFAAVAAAAIFGLVGTAANAQTPLLLDVHTIAGGDAATRLDPFERDVDIAQDGAYDLTLTDLGVPASFAALKLVVTKGADVVATATAAGTIHFNATAGTHVVRVAGALPSGQSAGAFGVHLQRVSDSTTVLDVAATFSLPPGALPANQQIIDTSFTVAAAGDYDVTLADGALPQALTTLSLLIAPEGSATPALTLNGPTASPVVLSGLQPGTYRLLVVGQADAAVSAGVFSVRVRAVGGAALVNQTATIGKITQLGTTTLAACTCTLTLTDFAIPAALQQSAVILLRDGQVVASATGSGSAGSVATNFSASAGDYAVLAYVVPAATPGTGTYGVDVRPQGGATAVFAAVQTAGGDVAGATPGYTYEVDVPSSGSYALRLADFQFPQAFGALSLAAVQDAAVLGTLNAAGTANLSLAAGKLFLLVAADTGGTSGALFGIDLTPAGGSGPVYATTQGVGGAFRAAHATLPAAASYDVAVTDLGFPVAFSELSAVVTQGATRLGSIFGGGSFRFTGVPGDVVVNVLAQPQLISSTAAQRAGTYAVSVVATPPPTVTLSASATDVKSGDTVMLTWSSSDATACTASGGWTGTRAVSGSETSAAIRAGTTFTLDCTGDGGSASQSVAVSVSASQNSGGGGALDALTLALLAGGVLACLRRRCRTAPAA